MVELRLLRDPFDTYDQMIPVLSKGKVKPAFYFLFAQKPYEGIATAIYNTKLQALIKGVSDDFPVSVLLSHHAQQGAEELAYELNNVKQLIHQNNEHRVLGSSRLLLFVHELNSSGKVCR